MLDHLKELCEHALAPTLRLVVSEGSDEGGDDEGSDGGGENTAAGDAGASAGAGGGGGGAEDGKVAVMSAAARFASEVLGVAERANARQLASAARHALRNERTQRNRP